MGSSLPTNKGYDVKSGTIQRRNRTLRAVNGRLQGDENAGLGIQELLIFDISTGFSLNGETAQSRFARSYFPRHRSQQTLSVSCQFPDQELYGEAIEWIRRRQQAQDVLRLMVMPKYMPVKGQGARISVSGYISQINRSHERFVYAPELTFNFLVKDASLPTSWADPHDDRNNKVKKLDTWRDVMENKKVFIRDPEATIQRLAAENANQSAADLFREIRDLFE